MLITKTIEKGLAKEAIYIREKVFVEEQGFHDEFDELDETAFHLIIYCDGKMAATGRLLINDGKAFKIGRVAVLKEYRDLKLGYKIMEYLEERAREEGATSIVLSAQCPVQGFYEKNGYTAYGDTYYDQHCPHINMKKVL